MATLANQIRDLNDEELSYLIFVYGRLIFKTELAEHNTAEAIARYNEQASAADTNNSFPPITDYPEFLDQIRSALTSAANDDERQIQLDRSLGASTTAQSGLASTSAVWFAGAAILIVLMSLRAEYQNHPKEGVKFYISYDPPDPEKLQEVLRSVTEPLSKALDAVKKAVPRQADKSSVERDRDQ